MHIELITPYEIGQPVNENGFVGIVESITITVKANGQKTVHVILHSGVVIEVGYRSV